MLKKKEADKIINYYTAKFNLSEFTKKKISNLSGGTKKRVDIICALLNNPEIVIFDEPFLGLDPSLVNSLLEVIVDLKKAGRTSIISSHILNGFSDICDRIFFLNQGKLLQIQKSNLNKIYD
ncbi:MAG: ATP-binding cassette domain-containing protein [Nanoarchaeota archaeon]